MTTVLFWDIDGTLLTTGRAGIFALEDAAAEVIGKKLDLSNLPTAGLTDREIASAILKLGGMTPEADAIEDILELYGYYLPASLPRRQGSVLAGVREILDIIQGRLDVVCLLLTGNIEAGAKAKLSYYGLDGYFTQGGAFSDKAENRMAIANQALLLAESILGEIPKEKLYVIGDTPHDIRCSQAIQARAIAVASGTYNLQQLLEYQPWWAITSLPQPDEFLQKIGLED